MARKSIPRKKLNTLVREYLPEFIQSEEDYQTFVAFMEAFYEYLEEDRNAGGVARNLRSLKDIDTTLDSFVSEWENTLAEHLPRALIADKRLVLKHMKDVYQAKGTEKSYKLLFRILFNEDIQIRYPGEQMLIASGGDWREFITLQLINESASLFETEYTSITGQTSGATGVVERVERRVEGGQIVYFISYSTESKNGDFVQGEIVEFEGGQTATLSEAPSRAGEFVGDQGLLNTEGGILQDSEFYQSFSYVIQAGEPSFEDLDDPDLLAALGIGIWSWRDIIKKILHPAGLLLFSELRINTVLTAERVNITSFISLVIWSLLDVTTKLGANWLVKMLPSGYVRERETFPVAFDEMHVKAIGPSISDLNRGYQMTIPFDRSTNAMHRNVSQYRYIPSANKTIRDPDLNVVDPTTYEGVYWDTWDSAETNYEHVEQLVGYFGDADTYWNSDDLNFLYEDFLDGKLAKKRLKLGRDAYIYQRTVT